MSETPSAESDAVCCWCGMRIAQVYAGTFWKAPDPMPMKWVHVATNDRACGYAEPTRVTPPAETREARP